MVNDNLIKGLRAVLFTIPSRHPPHFLLVQQLCDLVYLAALNEDVIVRQKRLIEQFARTEDITEDLKAADQMAWVGAMNSIHNHVEGIIRNELICQ